ncbi:MAG: hypothetical protein WHZ52_01710 [Armatimonadota bacterium]
MSAGRIRGPGRLASGPLFLAGGNRPRLVDVFDRREVYYVY